MRVLGTCLKFVAGVAVVLITTSDARTETIKLETKRLPSSSMALSSSEDAAFRSRYYQSFYTRDGSYVRMSGQPDFSKVVVKEPEYASARPFKGVAKLGAQEFAFAFDTASADSKSSETVLVTLHPSSGTLYGVAENEIGASPVMKLVDVGAHARPATFVALLR